jgi:hypothetical protein
MARDHGRSGVAAGVLVYPWPALFLPSRTAVATASGVLKALDQQPSVSVYNGLGRLYLCHLTVEGSRLAGLRQV